MKWDEEKFPERIRTGDATKGNGIKPVETPGIDQNSVFCQLNPTSSLCQATGGGNEDDDNDDGNTGNNGNGGGPGPR
jgi:hypothetical protein